MTSVVAVALTGAAWAWLYYGFFRADDALMLHDFPYQFISDEAGARPYEKRMSGRERGELILPFKDPASGASAWLWVALQCENQACPALLRDGAPAVFAASDPGFLAWAESGFPDRGDAGVPPDIVRPCPHCGQTRGVADYLTPEGKAARDAQRRKVLAQ